MPLPDLNQRSRTLVFAYAALAGAAAVVGALALPPEGLPVSLGHFRWVALGSIIVILPLLALNGFWSAIGAYAAVFWCFHFGLIAVLGLGAVRPSELSLWDQLWVLGPFAGDASLVALVGFAALGCGASLVKGFGMPITAKCEPAGVREGAHPHGVAGSVLVVLAIGIWCAIVFTTRSTAGFFASYGEYLDATADYSGILAFVWLSLGCGLVISVTGPRGWLRAATISAFGAFALVALPLGLRGEVMFPSIAALVAAARCGSRLSSMRTAAFIAALLVVIPSVREVRNTGLQGLPDMVLDLRMFDAFAEMGGSLHPVEKVVRWRAEGDVLDMGASYWAPIERAASRVLPGVQTRAAEDDMRIMNVLVTDRVGPIGFSPVAEAYRNFGAFGVALVLGLLGAALAGLDHLPSRRVSVLVIAALYVPLLTNVRNSFVSVPLQCALGLGFVLALGAARHVSAVIRCSPYAGSPYVRREV